MISLKLNKKENEDRLYKIFLINPKEASEEEIGELKIFKSKFLYEVSREKKSIREISIKIYPKYRNKGYAKRALRLIIDTYGNKNMELYSIVKTDNLVSLSVHDKLKAKDIKLYEKDNDLYKCYIF